MRYLIVVLMLGMNFVSVAQPESIWQLLANGSIVRWVYSGGDEFNGTQLDESKWMNSFPWGRNYVGYCAQEYMTDGSNITLENGILKLTARRENIYARGVPYESDTYALLDGGPNLRWWSFTSGMIYSKQTYKHGLYEIRFKIPEVKGTWPAFWLFGGHPNEEMDIFECKGESPNSIHWDMHGPEVVEGSPSEPGGWVALNGSLGSGFNNMMGEASPNMSFWYLNGQEFAYWLGNRNYQSNIIASLQIANNDGSGNDCGFEPGPDLGTVFPATFEIDFIRVWTKIDCDQPIVLSNYTQSLTDQTVRTGSTIDLTDFTLPSSQNLSCLALDKVVIHPQTFIQGKYNAKIISECPGPTRAESSNFDESQYGNLQVADSTSLLMNEEPQKTLMYTKIFPNPSNGLITIEFSGKLEETIVIELINSNGISVYKETVSTEKIDIDVSKLPKGVYSLKGTFGDKSISNTVILN